MGMLNTAEIDMAETIIEEDLLDFLTNAAWDICLTYHTVLKISPGAATLGSYMFDVPFIADWKKIGDYEQHQTNQYTAHENNCSVE